MATMLDVRITPPDGPFDGHHFEFVGVTGRVRALPSHGDGPILKFFVVCDGDEEGRFVHLDEQSEPQTFGAAVLKAVRPEFDSDKV